MKRLFPFLLLILIALIYTRPFFRKGFFPTHDGEWAIIRLSEMQREIKDFQIPPRWSDYLNHGFGYPLFSFTYPGPYYIGIILRIFNISLVNSIKTIFVLSVVFSAVFMYLLGRELGGSFAGFISSVFYVVAPFRLVNLYVRGSIGESVCLALFPLLFYLGIKYVQKPNLIRLVSCSIALAFLILSHNIMALLFFPIFIVFLYIEVISYFEDIKLYTFRYFLPMILLGFGLCAFFFIPAIFEKQYIILSQVRLADTSIHFVRLSDYLFSPWNYGTIPSFQLGWAHILATVIAFASVLFFDKVTRKKYFPFAALIFIGIIFLIILMHPVSSKLWNIAPLLWLDFPWRLLTPLAFFISLAKIFLSVFQKTRIISFVLVIITVVLSLNFAKPEGYINKNDDYYLTNDATTTSMDELMPVWVADKPRNRYANKVEVEKGEIAVSDLSYNSRMIQFETDTSLPGTVKVNTIYFPGWEFTLDGDRIVSDYSNPQGIMKLAIPAGRHKVRGFFSETKIRFWADIISLLSIITTSFLLTFSFVRRMSIFFSNRQAL